MKKIILQLCATIGIILLSVLLINTGHPVLAVILEIVGLLIIFGLYD